MIGDVRAVGFDSVTNYVLLPYWRGPDLQDYAEVAAKTVVVRLDVRPDSA